MRLFEVGVALALALAGARSAWGWARRPLDGGSVGDQVLYALYRTGRVGLWFAFAGLFALYAVIDAGGRAFIDEADRFRWYVFVPLGLASMQLLAGLALGRRGSEAPESVRPRGGGDERPGPTEDS